MRNLPLSNKQQVFCVMWPDDLNLAPAGCGKSDYSTARLGLQ